MKKNLSVIIPGYNTPEKWWRRCIDSVLRAIGPDDEIICVDDGSSANPSFLAGLAQKDKRIIPVFLKKNGGLSNARNSALARTRGRFVTFVDSDDEVFEETFGRCIETLERDGSDIAFYGVQIVWPDIGLERVDVLPDRFYGKLTPVDVETIRTKRLLNYACNKVYRLDFLNRHGLRFNPNGMPCEDEIFNLGCLMAGAKWSSVNFVGYKYYRMDGTAVGVYWNCNLQGVTLGVEAWERYCATNEDARRRFGKLTRLSESELLRDEWKNIWRLQTPYSIWGRWKWLSQNKGQMGIGIGLVAFVRMFVFTFLRRHFYFRFVRRAWIRRMYPDARNLVRFGYRLFDEASSYSENANAYQKIALVKRLLSGEIVVPPGCKDWVPEVFRGDAVSLSLFSRKVSHWCFQHGGEIQLLKIILFSLFVRKPYVFFCWDPPGITIQNRVDIKGRIRAWILNSFFGIAVRRSCCTIVNLHPGFIDTRFGRVVREKCRFFPNGTNVRKNQEDARGVRHVHKRIAINSGFTSDKGCWELAHLLVRVWKEDSEVSVVWIGFGKELESVKEWMFAQGMSADNLVIPGRIPCSDAMRLLASGDFALNMYGDVPSLRWNYILKMPEFLSLGLPVISSRSPGGLEYLQEGETGVSFDTGATDAAYRCVKWLLEHPEEVERMRSACLKRAERYDWAAINRQILVTILESIDKE